VFKGLRQRRLYRAADRDVNRGQMLEAKVEAEAKFNIINVLIKYYFNLVFQ